jgi:hypothetical protein
MFAEGPANTLSYMIAGFSVIFGAMLIYVISLIVRSTRLHREDEALQELEQK